MVVVTNEEIKDKIIKIVSEQMGVEKSEITMETSFVNDLNADSLDTVELVMEFEDEFELKKILGTTLFCQNKSDLQIFS